MKLVSFFVFCQCVRDVQTAGDPANSIFRRGVDSRVAICSDAVYVGDVAHFCQGHIVGCDIVEKASVVGEDAGVNFQTQLRERVFQLEGY